jgi:hypothetical protein
MTIHQSISALSSCLAACAIIVAFVAGLPAVAFGQHIVGTVGGDETEALQGIQVTFFDSATAETLGSTTTTFAGAYDSGHIPAGNYRVRFSDPFGVGSPGYYLPEFFGAAGADSFCAATMIPVPLAGTSVVNEVMHHSEPRLVAEFDGGISGFVRNAVTGAPLPGIEVRLLDAANAMVLSITQTNADGTYAIGKITLVSRLVRVRFFDPTGVFFPRYFVGAGTLGPDDFCAGTPLDLGAIPFDVNAYLEPIPPAQLTDNLAEAVEALNLPSNVESMLRTPLTQAVALLNDTNANNDTAVCAQLQSFISRIDIQEARGQLRPSDATAVREATGAILAALGCQ